MSLVNFNEMMADAMKRRYAVPMFDVANTIMMRAAVETAEEAGSPVILASLPFDVPDEAALGYWYNSALYAARQVKVPVCLHLDHATDIESCRTCIDLGYQSVMIDASAKEFAENAALSAEVARLAHAKGIAVEAELGHVATGITGVNDGGSESGLRQDVNTIFTDPASVARFIELTHVDALAVSIGTTHGVYISAPRLDIPLLRELKQAAGNVPLVLHGGSGTPEDQLTQAIENGIAKINIYSELTAAWNTAMRDFLVKREQMTCWFAAVLKEPIAAMRYVMRQKMQILKSAGQY